MLFLIRLADCAIPVRHDHAQLWRHEFDDARAALSGGRDSKALPAIGLLAAFVGATLGLFVALSHSFEKSATPVSRRKTKTV